MTPDNLVDDRPDEGIFRVNREAFVDPGLFEREIREIFERCWLYLGHESQVPRHGDYFSARMGRHPVFVIRGSDGRIRCFYDACTHRGSRLTGRTSGTAKTLTCRYHGWGFSADGNCTLVRGRDEAYLEPDLDRMGTDLRPIAQFDGYKGFLFGCLDPSAPPLEDFLGGAKPFIDLMADQSPDGMEVLRGESRYVMEANWKFQTENSTDGYHVATVHRNFATTVGYRETLLPEDRDAMAKTEASRILSLDKIGSGGYDVGNGHMINWADRGNPEAGPLWPQREALLQRFPEGKVKWMLERGRTVTVFPNLLLNDVASTCIRVWRPVSVGLTEIETWCLAPRGEAPEARRARIRKYEDFFFPASLAVPDDVRAMEGAHTGSLAMEGGWNDLALGRKTLVDGADDAAQELGFVLGGVGAVGDHGRALGAAVGAGDGEDRRHLVGFGCALQPAEHVDVQVLGLLGVLALPAPDRTTLDDAEVTAVALLAQLLQLGDGGGVVRRCAGDGVHVWILLLGRHCCHQPGRERSHLRPRTTLPGRAPVASPPSKVIFWRIAWLRP